MEFRACLHPVPVAKFNSGSEHDRVTEFQSHCCQTLNPVIHVPCACQRFHPPLVIVCWRLSPFLRAALPTRYGYMIYSQVHGG